MKFAVSEFLILFLTIPILIYYIKIILKINLKLKEKIFLIRNYEQLSNFKTQPNFTIKLIAYICCLILIIFAATRPQGLEKLEEVEAHSIDICFVIDVSESMRALDLGANNRLDVTKAVVSHLIDNLKTDRVAIIAFSGLATCICPLTFDYNTAKSILNQVNFDLIDKGGTRLDLAIETAINRFEKDDKNAKVIILFTDGEEHDSKTYEAAKLARDNGIIIHCVGIGSKTGAKIPIGYDIWGNPIYKKYKGQDVVTKLNEKILIDIADITKGTYFHVFDQKSLNNMITSLKNIKKRALRKSTIGKREELYHYFAALALILLIIDTLIPKYIQKNTNIFKEMFKIPKFINNLILIVIIINQIFFYFSSFVYANSLKSNNKMNTNDLKYSAVIKKEYTPNANKIDKYINEGSELYIKKDYYGAEQKFQNAKILNPKDIVTNYNIGCAKYKNNDFKGAIEAFKQAISADSNETQFEPYYNMGNAYFKLFDYQNAINCYEKALKIKPNDEDTLYNLELAKKKLQEQLQKQQMQNQDNQKNQNQENQQCNQNQQQNANNENQQNKANQQQNNNDKNNENKQMSQNQQNQNINQPNEQQAQNEQQMQSQANQQNGQNNINKEEVKDLVDKENIEKYKNVQIDPRRLRLFLKDLEKDEARIQAMFYKNRNRLNKTKDDEDLFNMSPEEIHEHMLRQMMPDFYEKTQPKNNNKANSNVKDW